MRENIEYLQSQRKFCSLAEHFLKHSMVYGRLHQTVEGFFYFDNFVVLSTSEKYKFIYTAFVYLNAFLTVKR